MKTRWKRKCEGKHPRREQLAARKGAVGERLGPCLG